MATYIGGIGFFIGPIIGAIFVTYLSLVLSDLTTVWQLYFGLFFIAVVMFAPGGIIGLLMKHRPLVRAEPCLRSCAPIWWRLFRHWPSSPGSFWRSRSSCSTRSTRAKIPHVRAFGVHFNAASPLIWLLAAALLIGGFSVARCVQGNAASAPGKCSCSAAQAPDKRQNLGPLGLNRPRNEKQKVPRAETEHVRADKQDAKTRALHLRRV